MCGVAPKVLDSDMVCRNLRLAYFLEVGSMQIMVDHETLFIVYHVGLYVELSFMIVSLGP